MNASKYVVRSVVALICAALLWAVIYSDPYDPKNLHYLAWKWRLLPLAPDRALEIMGHDAHSESLVRGMTKEELEQRFGYVLTADQVSPYLREYCAAARPLATVLFLNSKNYMVVMSQGKVSELVLCKG